MVGRELGHYEMGNTASWEQEANRQRAQDVFDRQAREGFTHRDMSPAWLLGAVERAQPTDVTFAKVEKRGGIIDTMGVAVFQDHPQQDALEIEGIFGPGMGDALFGQAERRARLAGRKDLIAKVTPGAKEAYRARGFATDGPQRLDGSHPMRKAVDLRPPAFQTVYPGEQLPAHWRDQKYTSNSPDNCLPFAMLVREMWPVSDQSTGPFKPDPKVGQKAAVFKTIAPTRRPARPIVVKRAVG